MVASKCISIQGVLVCVSSTLPNPHPPVDKWRHGNAMTSYEATLLSSLLEIQISAQKVKDNFSFIYRENVRLLFMYNI